MAYGQAIQALADPTRREIFERLRGGPQPVGELADGLHVTRPAVSQHLKVLAGAGLVRARREGTRRIYSVEIHGLQDLRRYLDHVWGEALEAFRVEADRVASSDLVASRPAGRPAVRRRPVASRPTGRKNTRSARGKG